MPGCHRSTQQKVESDKSNTEKKIINKPNDIHFLTSKLFLTYSIYLHVIHENCVAFQ